MERVDDENIYIYIKTAPTRNRYTISKETICNLLESGKEFSGVKDMREKMELYHDQVRSYEYDLYQRIKAHMKSDGDTELKTDTQRERANKYVFIIDEINRGNISQVFGELFFSIDPGYRGEKGGVITQYANMQKPVKKFYIPKNVYIIGTMNDIDRSVDSFDFAMRRRFRFIEVTADEHADMLDALQDKYDVEEIKSKMASLNKAIEETEGLSRHYQIGPAYFLNLKDIEGDNPLDVLWNDYLEPLLQDYVQGFDGAEKTMERFETAYKRGLGKQ